jgi:hypothetical protein
LQAAPGHHFSSSIVEGSNGALNRHRPNAERVFARDQNVAGSLAKDALMAAAESLYKQFGPERER